MPTRRTAEYRDNKKAMKRIVGTTGVGTIIPTRSKQPAAAAAATYHGKKCIMHAMTHRHLTRIVRSIPAWLGLLSAAWLAQESVASPGLTLSPSTIAWHTNTWVNFDLNGITGGASVKLKLYAHIDRSIGVGSNDVQLMQFDLKDGVNNSLGSKIVVCDTNGLADGHIQGRISYHGVSDFGQFWHAAGQYIWQATDTNNIEIARATFTITPATGNVWIAGSVQAMTNPSPMAGYPLPGALVVMNVFSPLQAELPATWADTNGNFSLCLPSGMTTDNVSSVMALKPGYFESDTGPDPMTPLSTCPFTQPLHGGTNMLPGPLYLVPAIPGMVATLSGSVVDSASNTLGGVFLIAQQKGSDHSGMSFAVSGPNGAFAMPWPQGNSDTVDLNCMTPALNLRGLTASGLSIGPVNADVSGLLLVSPIATTLVTGKVRRSEDGDGVSGAIVRFNGSTLGAETFSFGTNGNFELCCVGDSNCSVELVSDSLRPKHRVCPNNLATIVTLPSSGSTNVTTFMTDPGYVISGHVYDGQASPLCFGNNAGVYAQATNQNNNDADDESPNPNGVYQLLVPAGTYRIGTWQFDNYGFVNGNYQNDVTVTTNDVGGIDFYLSLGTTISGTVSAGGVPLSGVNVQVGTIIFQQGGGWNWDQTYNGNGTDSNGNYSITVPPGTNYYVQVNTPSGSTWLGQFYRNARDPSSAMVVTALANVPTTNINFTLQAGTTVSGFVRGYGTGISGLWVAVGTITTNQGGGWNWNESYYNWNTTDTNGYYTVTVPPGTNYYAQVSLPNGSQWLRQMYNNASDYSSATVIVALTNRPATNINFNLQAGAIVSGCVKGGGMPLSGINLTVGTITFQQGSSWNWNQTYGGNSTDSNGNYAFTVPPGTNYYVQANPPNGAAWLGQFYNNATNASSATVIAALTNAPATNINFNLQLQTGDSVGDGIPDWWRALYFGGTGTTTNSVSGATCDPDHDGMNNWQEYVAGTNPTNSSSVLRFNSEGSAPGQHMAIRWASVSNRLYDLYRSTNLSAGATAFITMPGATNMPATPPENTYTDTVQGGGPRLYKINVHQ